MTRITHPINFSQNPPTPAPASRSPAPSSEETEDPSAWGGWIHLAGSLGVIGLFNLPGRALGGGIVDAHLGFPMSPSPFMFGSHTGPTLSASIDVGDNYLSLGGALGWVFSGMDTASFSSWGAGYGPRLWISRVDVGEGAPRVMVSPELAFTGVFTGIGSVGMAFGVDGTTQGEWGLHFRTYLGFLAALAGEI